MIVYYSEGHVGLRVKEFIAVEAHAKDGVLNFPQPKKVGGMVENSLVFGPHDGQSTEDFKTELESVKKVNLSTANGFWFGTNLAEMQNAMPNLQCIQLAENSDFVPFVSSKTLKNGKKMTLVLPDDLVEEYAIAENRAHIALDPQKKVELAKIGIAKQFLDTLHSSDEVDESALVVVPSSAAEEKYLPKAEVGRRR